MTGASQRSYFNSRPSSFFSHQRNLKDVTENRDIQDLWNRVSSRRQEEANLVQGATEQLGQLRERIPITVYPPVEAVKTNNLITPINNINPNFRTPPSGRFASMGSSSFESYQVATAPTWFQQFLPFLFLILAVALIVFLVYVFRKHIPTWIHYTEVFCEKLFRCLSLPFIFLYWLLVQCFYPYKQCLICSYLRIRHFCYPAERTTAPVYWQAPLD